MPDHCFQSILCNICTTCTYKSKKAVNTKATKDDVVSQTDIPTDTSDVSMEVFATRSADVVDDVIAITYNVSAQ